MRYLGVDWGLKKIGLAFSEGELASPIIILPIKGLENGVNLLMEVLEKKEADLVVIGRPEGETGKMVDKAVSKLKSKGIKVEVADETLSTKEAVREMVRLGVGKKVREDDDAYSAALILQRWLDENKNE